MICVFFGHHDCPDSVKPRLTQAIRDQIGNGARLFYVGTHGRFDALALSCLRSLKREFPEIGYAIVLAYLSPLPGACQPEETIFPEGIEKVPKRFAVDYRNRWMLDRADAVIAFVSRPVGGAAKHVKRAERKGVAVVNLANPAAE